MVLYTRSQAATNANINTNTMSPSTIRPGTQIARFTVEFLGDKWNISWSENVKRRLGDRLIES
jgi:hypothetical protein